MLVPLNPMHPSPAKRPLPVSHASLWWLHPFWIVAVPLLVISLVAYLLPEAEYRDNWRTPKAFDSAAFGLCIAVAAAFSAGCLLASWINAGFSVHRRISPELRDVRGDQRGLMILFGVAVVVTVTGYAIWFGFILKQGGIGMIKSMLTGGKWASDELKRTGMDSMITGVTTFTQFGMGTVLLGTYLGFTQGWRKVVLRLAMLLVLTLFRAVLLSERLSLIEVVLPSAVLFIRLIGYGRPGSALRRFLIIAPVVGIAGLFALFTFTEYFRSWSSFYADRGTQSLFSFSLLRLLGYYVTALNNGAIIWHGYGALYFPYATLDWLWRFPLIGHTLRGMLGGDQDVMDLEVSIVTAEGNVEFNNPSGIFVVFTDLGVAGAYMFFVIYGCMAALLYGSYRRGSIAGLFLYPFVFIGMSEQVRILYSTGGRAFPTWLLLLMGVLISRSVLRRGRSLRKSPAQPHPASVAPPP